MNDSSQSLPIGTENTWTDRLMPSSPHNFATLRSPEPLTPRCPVIDLRSRDGDFELDVDGISWDIMGYQLIAC